MSMIFQFRVLSDENDHFMRDYQVEYNATLHDFHNFICDDLEFDRNTMVSFFLSDRSWDKLREFTLVDMGGNEEDSPVPMESITLQELIRENGDRLIYTFDMFGNRSLYMEMIGVYKSESGAEYPRAILAEGNIPVQFLTADITVAEGSIFDEAMNEFGDFEGDDNYDDF